MCRLWFIFKTIISVFIIVDHGAERYDLKFRIWLFVSPSSSLSKKERKRKGEWKAKIVILSHTFLIDLEDTLQLLRNLLNRVESQRCQFFLQSFYFYLSPSFYIKKRVRTTSLSHRRWHFVIHSSIFNIILLF